MLDNILVNKAISDTVGPADDPNRGDMITTKLLQIGRPFSLFYFFVGRREMAHAKSERGIWMCCGTSKRFAVNPEYLIRNSDPWQGQKAHRNHKLIGVGVA